MLWCDNHGETPNAQRLSNSCFQQTPHDAEEVLAMEEAWCCKIAERHMPEIERAVHMAIETDEPITIDDLLLP